MCAEHVYWLRMSLNERLSTNSVQQQAWMRSGSEVFHFLLRHGRQYRQAVLPVRSLRSLIVLQTIQQDGKCGDRRVLTPRVSSAAHILFEKRLG